MRMTRNAHDGTRPKENGDSPGGGRGPREHPTEFANQLGVRAQDAIARSAGRVSMGQPLVHPPAVVRVKLVTEQGVEVTEGAIPAFRELPRVLLWGSRVFLRRDGGGATYEEVFFVSLGR